MDAVVQPDMISYLGWKLSYLFKSEKAIFFCIILCLRCKKRLNIHSTLNTGWLSFVFSS